MNEELEFGLGSSKGNDSAYAAPKAWVWAAEGSGISAVYDSKGYPLRPTPFFAVGWQVIAPREPARQSAESERIVRLWVDSPREEDSAELNALKREFVKAMMESDLRQAIRAHGFICDEAHLWRSDATMRRTRTTTIFKIELSQTEGSGSREESIKTVHAALAPLVHQVLSRFSDRLEGQF